MKFKVTKQQVTGTLGALNCAVSLSAACVGACLMLIEGVSVERKGGVE